MRACARDDSTINRIGPFQTQHQLLIFPMLHGRLKEALVQVTIHPSNNSASLRVYVMESNCLEVLSFHSIRRRPMMASLRKRGANPLSAKYSARVHERHTCWSNAFDITCKSRKNRPFETAWNTPCYDIQWLQPTVY